MLIDKPGEERTRYKRTEYKHPIKAMQHYFIGRDTLTLVVCETPYITDNDNWTLKKLIGRVVDVSIDVDTQPDRYTVLKQNTGKPHRRAIIHKKMTGKGFDLTLTQFLDDMKPNGQE
jgi:hypothetical protein